MEIAKKDKEIIFKNFVPIFELAISQPIQYVKRYFMSVAIYRARIKAYLGLFEATDT
jgi:hypothetical protein